MPGNLLLRDRMFKRGLHQVGVGGDATWTARIDVSRDAGSSHVIPDLNFQFSFYYFHHGFVEQVSSGQSGIEGVGTGW